MMEKYTLLRIHDRIPRVLLHVYSMILVIAGWGIFYFDDFGTMLVFFNAFTGNAATFTDFVSQSALTDKFWLWTTAVVFCMPVRRQACRLTERVLGRDSSATRSAILVSRVGISLAVLVLSVALLVGATNNAFLYTRF